jgi:hypothetical protein
MNSNAAPRPALLLRCLIWLTVLCALSACHYYRAGMYVDVSNRSGAPLRGVEVNYPGGTYGLASLDRDTTSRHWAQISSPCRFSFRFQDERGHQLPEQKFDLGAACPKEVAFEIDAQRKINARIVER